MSRIAPRVSRLIAWILVVTLALSSLAALAVDAHAGPRAGMLHARASLSGPGAVRTAARHTVSLPSAGAPTALAVSGALAAPCDEGAAVPLLSGLIFVPPRP